MGALEPLRTLMVEPLVRAALLEDLGRAGDITTEAVVPASASVDGGGDRKWVSGSSGP